MYREEDRVLAGAAIVLMASLSSMGRRDQETAARMVHLTNSGLKMMGVRTEALPHGQISEFLVPAAESLFERFAPVESVMES